MIPQLLTVRVKRPHGRPIRIWIPILPVVLVLAPVVVLTVVLAAVVTAAVFLAARGRLTYRVRVMPALGVGWRIVSALPGTRVDVEQGRMAVLVTIR